MSWMTKWHSLDRCSLSVLSSHTSTVSMWASPLPQSATVACTSLLCVPCSLQLADLQLYRCQVQLLRCAVEDGDRALVEGESQCGLWSWASSVRFNLSLSFDRASAALLPPERDSGCLLCTAPPHPRPAEKAAQHLAGSGVEAGCTGKFALQTAPAACH